jgi:hypothetical protein
VKPFQVESQLKIQGYQSPNLARPCAKTASPYMPIGHGEFTVVLAPVFVIAKDFTDLENRTTATRQ